MVPQYLVYLHMRDRTWPSVRNTSSNVQIFWDLNSPMNRVQLCTWWLFLLTTQKLIQGYALVLLHERLLLKPSNYQNCKNWMDNWIRINVLTSAFIPVRGLFYLLEPLQYTDWDTQQLLVYLNLSHWRVSQLIAGLMYLLRSWSNPLIFLD